MKIRSLIILLCSVMLLFIGITIGIYFYKFHGGLSSDKGDFGTFGDFFGGILNPIIGIANLAVFIYLTHTISKIDERTSDKALETQKALFKLELKHNAYNEISTHLAKLPDAMMYKEPLLSLESVSKYLNLYCNMLDNNAFLFPSISAENSKETIDMVNDLHTNLGQVMLEMDLNKRKDKYLIVVRGFKYHEFMEKKNVFLNKIQVDLIG